VPYCCYYIGAFQDSKQIYIVMEHCTGGDLLEQLLKEGRAMTEKRVVREVRRTRAWQQVGDSQHRRCITHVKRKTGRCESWQFSDMKRPVCSK
jgi:serine/threonine protein kinase